MGSLSTNLFVDSGGAVAMYPRQGARGSFLPVPDLVAFKQKRNAYIRIHRLQYRRKVVGRLDRHRGQTRHLDFLAIPSFTVVVLVGHLLGLGLARVVERNSTAALAGGC